MGFSSCRRGRLKSFVFQYSFNARFSAHPIQIVCIIMTNRTVILQLQFSYSFNHHRQITSYAYDCWYYPLWPPPAQNQHRKINILHSFLRTFVGVSVSPNSSARKPSAIEYLPTQRNRRRHHSDVFSLTKNFRRNGTFALFVRQNDADKTSRRRSRAKQKV